MQKQRWGKDPADLNTHDPAENPTVKRRRLRELDKTRAKLAAMARPRPDMEAAGVR